MVHKGGIKGIFLCITGLEALRKRLGLESSLTDEHEGHDHARRRRSAVDVEAILEPATWVSEIYCNNR